MTTTLSHLEAARRKYVTDLAASTGIPTSTLTAANIDLVPFFDAVVANCRTVLQGYARSQSEALEVAVAQGAANVVGHYGRAPSPVTPKARNISSAASNQFEG